MHDSSRATARAPPVYEQKAQYRQQQQQQRQGQQAPPMPRQVQPQQWRSRPQPQPQSQSQPYQHSKLHAPTIDILHSQDMPSSAHAADIDSAGGGDEELRAALAASYTVSAAAKPPSRGRGSSPNSNSNSNSNASIYFGNDFVVFKPVLVGTSKSKKPKICNSTGFEVQIEFAVVGAAFSVSHRNITLQPFSYVHLPVVFSPPTSGQHRGSLVASYNVLGSGVVEVALPLQGSTKDVVWK